MIIPKDDDVIMHRYIDMNDPDTVIDRLVAFTAAGMRAVPGITGGKNRS